MFPDPLDHWGEEFDVFVRRRDGTAAGDAGILLDWLCHGRLFECYAPYQYAPYQHMASIIAAQLFVETAVRGGKRWSGWGDELSTFEETDWGILDQANFTWTLKLDAPQDVVSAALDLMGGWDQIYGEHVATGGAGINADKLGRLATFHAGYAAAWSSIRPGAAARTGRIQSGRVALPAARGRRRLPTHPRERTRDAPRRGPPDMATPGRGGAVAAALLRPAICTLMAGRVTCSLEVARLS